MRTIRQILFVRREWTEGDDAAFVKKVNELVQKRDVVDVQWSMSGTQPVGAILHCIDEPEESSPIVSLSDKTSDPEAAGIVRGEEKRYDEEDEEETVTDDEEEEF